MSRVTAAGSSANSRAPMRAPSAARMRPHDGSPPKMPDLTRLPPATARARSRATARSGTPGHVDHQQLGGPLAVGGDRARQLAAEPDQRWPGACRRAMLPASIAGAPDAPFASAMTQSLVDMSPSTVMVLNVSSTAGPSAACSTSGPTRASVAMKQSIVAICGWIIPDPLAIAANLTTLPPRSISRKASLVRRSVVRIASAAPTTSSPSAATSAGAAATIRSIGSRVPIAPVDAVRTSSGPTPSAFATAPAIARSSETPPSPVRALALPLLATIARIPAAGQPRRRVAHRRRAHPVDREHPGRGRGRLRHDQRQVPPCGSRLLDPRRDRPEPESERRREALPGLGRALAHGALPGRPARPAVSSNPSIRFAFWTA